eukprot:CAMPEP_0197652858 /NCGR_PEP_ID=MMETSP1338-20131121/34700_1 /TAXON_ID=43686 ORGANISM="Pelagodinium beii, Strain RCC1491" /NCGR_SAMPLE_ID=MMETSP1338 /ASSEMBLY_ACC=CAM_ASM_000754 /LENGTH=268 /DNA_ID=CAMNT_0043227809 /DNA_START=29 /DNA_END=835 /DNA_ORIENTATION=+
MSTAVYAVHAARWAQQNNSQWLREIFRELCGRWSTKTPQLCEDGWHVVYSTMAKQWEREQAELLAASWHGRFQAWRIGAAAWTSSLGNWSRRHPLATSCGAGTASFAAGDVIVTKVVQQREVDWRQTSLMSLFGLSWIGLLQHCLYGKIFPKLVQASALSGWSSVVAQVAGDQGLYMPFIYLPAFYAAKEVAGPSGRDLGLDGTMPLAMRKYCDNLASDVKMIYGYWIPVQVFNFVAVPIASRVPYICAASFIWSVSFNASMASTGLS